MSRYGNRASLLNRYHMCTMERKRGQIIIQVIIFATLAIIVVGGLVQWASIQIKATHRLVVKERAFVVAEAGIEYYRWHLAHAAQDFQDGTGGGGPYVHDYYDKDGNHIGKFSLTITAPPIGSTLVTILVDGWADADPTIHRKIRAQMGKPSWAKYSSVSNAVVWFGSTEETFGPVHSNTGVRFDGIAHNLVTSATDKFTDPSHGGAQEFGVHTHNPIDPLPPSGSVTDANAPARPTVFLAGRSFPTAPADFTGLSATLSTLKMNAGKDFAPSGAQGYHMVLKTDNTYDVYKVTALVASPSGSCKNSQNETRWGLWSIKTETPLAPKNYVIPANGIVFFEDNVWVDGQINTSRVTVASGKFPETMGTNTSIIVNGNLQYTNFDGRDVIGLFAQGDVKIGLKSPDTMTFDAAMIAKNGATLRNYYSSSCGPEYVRTKVTFFGMQATYTQGYFSWGTNVSGYNTQITSYDSNLLLAPPPSFPLTTNQYSTLSWEEIK